MRGVTMKLPQWSSVVAIQVEAIFGLCVFIFQCKHNAHMYVYMLHEE